MPGISRRSFLRSSFAASAAVAAQASVFGAVPASGEVDILIVGAGAAGIAAARRVATANRRFALVEASDHIGGRCVTDTRAFSVPFDRGAHWIHKPDSNPLTKLASGTGLEIYPAPRAQILRVPPRAARDAEMEQYFSMLVQASRAVTEAGRGRGDVAARSALPRELGDWQASVEFALGPYSIGKDLGVVSAIDFSRADEREADAFCRQGYGALLAKLAAGVPVQLSSPVSGLDWDSAIEARMPSGRIRARAAIVTLSTDVLVSGGVSFSPGLPKRQVDALRALSLGSFDHIAFELPRNPFGLAPDDLVFEKSAGPKTAALFANVGGTSLCMVEIAGPFGRELTRQGEAAMTAFANDWLVTVFGASAKKSIKRAAVTRWSEDPLTRGAFSAASPGNADARKILMEPLRERIYFAGEAVHETLWGTVGGAWESGTRAAEAALRKMGAFSSEPEAREPRPRLRQRRR
ncbi:MAG: flavin monoamine oxidase family protein [Pseudolabrys sp.]